MLTETHPVAPVIEPTEVTLSKCFDRLSETQPGSEEWTKLMAEIVALQNQMDNP